MSTRRAFGTSRTSGAGNEAGDAYIKLAEVQIKLESKHDAASAWVEAAKALLKSDQKRELVHRVPTTFLRWAQCSPLLLGRSVALCYCCSTRGGQLGVLVATCCMFITRNVLISWRWPAEGCLLWVLHLCMRAAAKFPCHSAA